MPCASCAVSENSERVDKDVIIFFGFVVEVITSDAEIERTREI